MPFLLLFICIKFTPRLCSCKLDLWKSSQTSRWLGVNMSVVRRQSWGAIEYWMGGPSLSLTDTPSGSLWSMSLEFHPSGRAAITASNRASAGLPSPEFTCHWNSPPRWSTRSPLLLAGLYDLKSLADFWKTLWFHCSLTHKANTPHWGYI